MDPNGDFLSKITGLGKLLVGIIGLRYLMNPFALIGDILGLMDMLDSDPGMDPDPKTKPKPKITDALDDTLKKKGLNPEQIKEFRRLRDAGTKPDAEAQTSKEIQTTSQRYYWCSSKCWRCYWWWIKIWCRLCC